jgi:hypothetical protein
VPAERRKDGSLGNLPWAAAYLYRGTVLSIVNASEETEFEWNMVLLNGLAVLCVPSLCPALAERVCVVTSGQGVLAPPMSSLGY